MSRIVALLILACAGCATMRPENPRVEPYLVYQYGKVARVNASEGFVVLECAVLPKPGERFTLFREDTRIGTVRTTRIMSGRHAAADIEEGDPKVGDWFRGERPQPTGSEITP